MRPLFLLIFCPVAVFAQSTCPVPDIVLRSDDTGKAMATLAFPSKPPSLTMAEFQPALKDTGIVMDTVRRLDPPDSDNKVTLTVTNLIQRFVKGGCSQKICSQGQSFIESFSWGTHLNLVDNVFSIVSTPNRN